MILEPELPEATRSLARILRHMRIPYAVGGAFAMQFLGYVRATRDLDVLVLLPALRAQEFADALNAAGFAMRDANGHPIEVNVPEMVRSTRDIGQFRVWWKEVKVELFAPKVPLQDSILRRGTDIDLDGTPLRITTAEDLILLKMIFHRDKDLVDVRRLLTVNAETLDAAYLNEWIDKTLTDAAGAELREMMKRLAP